MLSPGDVGDLRVLERSVRLARALRRRGERDPVRVAAGRRVLSGPTRHEEQSDHALPGRRLMPETPRGRADTRMFVTSLDALAAVLQAEGGPATYNRRAVKRMEEG